MAGVGGFRSVIVLARSFQSPPDLLLCSILENSRPRASPQSFPSVHVRGRKEMEWPLKTHERAGVHMHARTQTHISSSSESPFSEHFVSKFPSCWLFFFFTSPETCCSVSSPNINNGLPHRCPPGPATAGARRRSAASSC